MLSRVYAHLSQPASTVIVTFWGLLGGWMHQWEWWVPGCGSFLCHVVQTESSAAESDLTWLWTFKDYETMDFREWAQALDLTYWFDRWSRAEFKLTLVPNEVQKALQVWEGNCGLWSETILCGIPWSIKTWWMKSAVSVTVQTISPKQRNVQILKIWLLFLRWVTHDKIYSDVGPWSVEGG